MVEPQFTERASTSSSCSSSLVDQHAGRSGQSALPVALVFRKLNTSTPMVTETGPALVRKRLGGEHAQAVDSGGLMALAPDQDEQFRAAARAVDKILKGADAGTLPIRYPERYFLTIKQQAAKAIGLDIPAGLLARADAIVR